MPGALKNLALAGLIAFVALTWARRQVDPSPYDYDEADYMFAASRGFVPNWFDAPSLSLPQFVRIGLTRGRDPSQSGDLSVMIRDSGDMDAYRHWHGTLYYFGLALAPPGASEHTVRFLSLISALLGLAVVYLGCLWLWPASPWGPIGSVAAAVSSLLFLWSPTVVKTTEIAPHILFSVVCLAALFALAKMRETGRPSHWYAALACCGMAFCTMELALALIVSALIVGHLERQRLLAAEGLLPLAGKSIAAFVTPVLLIWPAALIKLSFIKAYLFMAYLAVFRKKPWGDVNFLQTWTFRFKSMPVEWIAIAIALILFIRWKDSDNRSSVLRRQVSAFLIFAAVMLAAVLRVNSYGLRYALPFFPPLLVFAGCMLAIAISRLSVPLRWSVVAALALSVFLDTARQVNANPPAINQKTVALIDALRDPLWQGKTLLVPQGDIPTLHFYAQTVRFRGYYDASTIPARLGSEHFDGVVFPDEPAVHRP